MAHGTIAEGTFSLRFPDVSERPAGSARVGRRRSWHGGAGSTAAIGPASPVRPTTDSRWSTATGVSARRLDRPRSRSESGGRIGSLPVPDAVVICKDGLWCGRIFEPRVPLLRPLGVSIKHPAIRCGRTGRAGTQRGSGGVQHSHPREPPPGQHRHCSLGRFQRPGRRRPASAVLNSPRRAAHAPPCRRTRPARPRCRANRCPASQLHAEAKQCPRVHPGQGHRHGHRVRGRCRHRRRRPALHGQGPPALVNWVCLVRTCPPVDTGDADGNR
jgi:hypothetical protein